MATVTTDLVDVCATRLGVRTTGGTGRPLLLLNGLGTELDGWNPLLDQLAARPTIAFDPPGVGASPPWPTTASIPATAMLATQLLDQLGHDEVDVVGYSWGGLVAQQFAATAPERVRRLGLLATSFGLGSIPGSPWSMAQTAARHTAHSVSQGWGALTGAGPGASLLGLSAQWLAACSWSTLPVVSYLSQPTLVVAGSDDELVPVANSRLLAKLIPDAKLVVMPGVGHDLLRRASPDVARHLDDFFRID